MQSDDPPFLPPGTEVSAKFKGAYCEAKIKKIGKCVKCKVVLKEAPYGTLVVEEHLIKGTLEINQTVDVTQGKHLVKAIVQQVKDCSTYHVVFNDGDEKVLRRTQMCIKGAKHFDTDYNLDKLPLYNPDQYAAVPKPQKKKKKAKRKKRRKDDDSEEDNGKKRKKRAAASAATVAIGEIDQGDTECSGDAEMSDSNEESEEEDAAEKDDKRKTFKKEEDDKQEETKIKSQSNQKDDVSRLEELRTKLRDGIVVCVFEDSQRRGKWFPAVIVSPKAYRDAANKPKVLGKNEIALRSFQNNKYSITSLANLSLFEDQPITKKTLDSMTNQLRTAVDRANAFLSRGTLPMNWTAREVYGDASPRRKSSVKIDKKEERDEPSSSKKDDNKRKKVEKKVESSSSTSESSGEEEYGEERDLFVAQLYKFQEERGTPINRAPVLGGKDMDLYRFYRVVQDYGGCKRVTTNQLWKKVLRKLHLEGCPGATPVTVRKAYIRYLAHFNSFYKRLGWSLDELSITSTINSPRERRLIRPSELLNQKPTKKRKSSTVESKDRPVKKTKEKSGGTDSNETSRDPEPSTSRERSVSSPASTVLEKSAKDDVEKKHDRDSREEQIEKSRKSNKKEKFSESKKRKDKEKSVDKDKENEKEKEKVEENIAENARKAKEESSKKTLNAKEKGEKSKRLEHTKEDEEKSKKNELPAKDVKRDDKTKDEEKSKIDDKPKEIEENVDVKEEQQDDADDAAPELLTEMLREDEKMEEELVAVIEPISDSEVVATSDRSGQLESEIDQKSVEVEKDLISEKKDADVSDEDADSKRKKERKRTPKSERKSVELTDFTKVRDVDEGYRPANIISRFYLGQKVRAHHHGRWYDARVVTVEQPSVRELVELMDMHDEEGTGLSSYALTRVRQVLNSTRCFVHYLGWNSRYDESITLNKIRLSEKDDQASLDAILREMGDRIPRCRLDFLLRWSNSSDGVESLNRDEVSVPTNLFSMGGYRPRRVSISQYEQLSAAAAEGLKREISRSSGVLGLKLHQPSRAKTPTTISSKSEHTIASPSSLGTSPPLRSPSRTNELPPHYPISAAVTSPISMSSKRSRTASTACAGRESTIVTSSRSSTPNTSSTYPPIEREMSPALLILPPAPLLVETSSSFEFSSQYTLSPVQIDYAHSALDTSPIKEFASMTCNESPVKEKKKSKWVAAASCDCGFSWKYVDVVSSASDEHLRKTLESVIYECSVRDSIKEESDARTEREASAVPQTPTHDDSDAEPSGSGTPMRTDGEDNDKWSTSDNQSAGGRLMSPSRGRGKRKRASYNRHSTMVVDRKYVRAKAGRDDRKDDDSCGEEEEEESTRDTFISMKNRMYRLMEQEQSLDNFDLLGLPPLGDLSLPTDETIEMLEKRLGELREVYHNAKTELLSMEKKRRKRAEKRRERERASREALNVEKQ